MCVHCYKLAGDKTRHDILSLLKEKALRVNDITELLEVKQPTITHHLKRLSEAGLVQMEKRGREHWYTLEMTNECFVECGLLNGI